jgi:CGNR zinc finger/Putative stress-induced transcription regulator
MDPEEQPDRLARLAVDLVNLADDRLDDAGLARFLIDHGEAAPIELTPGDVDQLVQVRAELAAVFDAASGPGAEAGAAAGRGERTDAAAERVNRLLDRAQNPPRLSNHDGTPWHLHITADGAPWADWLGAVAGLGLARLLAEDGVTRLGRCAAPSCRQVFAGGPRNHPRRYCSPTCANRARVAAFRARRRQAS